ncbi:MAG: hypothetical protein M1815_004531 [Lichina confinis]|nr:MAG: hypothetical protein M1815_004531 [Lichina confinis]
MPSLEEPLEERLSFDFKNLPQHTPPLFVVGFQLWQIILLAATTIVVLVGLKRRYFSSISDVPGPFLATVSGNLWHLRYTFQGHLENEAIALHKKHGPFVRIGHNEVGIGHRDAVEQLLLARIRKGDFYKAFSFPDDRFVNQMSELDPQRHSTKNKNISAGSQLTNLLRSERHVDGSLKLLEGHLDRMAEDGKVPVDLSRWFNYFAFDVVGEITFSQRFGFLDTGLDVGDAYANGRMVLIYLSVVGRAYWLHKLLLANPVLDYFGLRPINHLEETTKAAIASRQSNPKEKDIFCAAITNVAAGSYTAGATLQAFFYHFLKNMQHWNRLQWEIDEAQARGELFEVVTYIESQQLSFLQACIKEAYRMHPVVGFHYPRVAPEGGITVAGRFFEKGTVLSVHPWVIHRDPHIFGSDADTFSPERWMASEEKVKKMNKYMINFGAGYNACPGRHLAHFEISKTGATLARDYDLELVDPKGTWSYSNHFLVVPHSWPCYIKRRTLSSSAGG